MRWTGGWCLLGLLGCGTRVLGVHASRVKRTGRVKTKRTPSPRTLPRDQGALTATSSLCHGNTTDQINAPLSRAALCSVYWLGVVVLPTTSNL